jgi:hypothetical protein
MYIKRRNGDIFEVKLDIDDLEKLIEYGYSWHVMWDENNKSWYARQSVAVQNDDETWTSRVNFLHRWLVGATENDHVDHRNQDTLDDRRKNLRVTTRDKNAANRKGANSNSSTGVRNVHLCKAYGGEYIYKVQIMRKGKRFLWEFPLDQFDAACKLAEEKRKELFGEFAGNGIKNT